MRRSSGAAAPGRTLRSPGAGAPALLAVVVVFLAVVAPLVAVVLRAVVVDGTPTLESLQRILGSPHTWRIAALTVGQAAASAIAALVVGVPVALVLARFRFPGRSTLRVVATVPFVLPSVVIAAAFSTLLGPDGPVDLRGTWWAVIAAHVCFNLAVVIRIVGAALESVDPDLEDVARLAGMGRLGMHRRVTLPLVLHAVRAAGVIVFLFCLTSFGVIVILGGGWVTTLEVELWNRATRQFDLSGAAVLAGLQAAVVVVTLVVAGGQAAPVAAPARSRRRRAVRPVGPAQWSAVGSTAVVVATISLLPLLALLERSLRVGEGYGFANWVSLGSATAGTSLAFDPLSTLGASLAAAVPAALMAILLGVPAASAVAARPRGVAGRVLLLPLAVSATTIGLGLLLLPGALWAGLRSSGALVVLAQTLVALPLVVRGVAPALGAVPPAYRDAAALAGMSHRRTWWTVELPVVRPALVAAAGLALIATLGEFGATVFVARRGAPTVPVAIERLLSRPGQSGMGQAMALSVVLAVLCGLVLAAVDRLGGRRAGAGGSALTL